MPQDETSRRSEIERLVRPPFEPYTTRFHPFIADDAAFCRYLIESDFWLGMWQLNYWGA